MTGTASTIPILQPRVLLGLNTKVRYNAQYISDEEIIYPVGSVLCIHNYNQKKQKFIKLPDKGSNVTNLTVSGNKKFVAIAESSPDKSPTVTIYDPWTCKKKKQIGFPIDKENAAKEFVAMSFTCDAKSIILVSGEPDFTMYVYRVDKGKLESTARANNSNGTGTINQIAPNPNDSNLLVLVGNQLFRNMSCSDFNWRQFGFGKADQMNLTCAVWISQDRLIAGSIDGKLMFFENADLKAVFLVYDLPTITLKVADEIVQQAITSVTNLNEAGDTISMQSVFKEDIEIKSLICFNKGLAFACQTGTIHFYEKETQHKYKKRNVFKMPDHTIERDDDDADDDMLKEQRRSVLNAINSIGINISEDRLISTCNETQIYTTRLWGPDINTSPEINLVELGMPLHHGQIGSLSVCSWKPIFMTTGVWDRTLRIWNYENETLELMKKFTEDLYTCSLHPSGLFAVVGFSDKLRFLKILIEDFENTREFPIRGCKLCCFSKLGHLFAAVNGNIIQVYSATSFEHFFNLKGHNGTVTGLSWMHDDYKLASCGTEGAVYEWQISTTRRICETIIKVCQFSDVVMTNDGKSVFGVGSDGRLREIMNSNVHRDVAVTTNGTGIDHLALSNSDLMFFCTGNNGSVYSVKLPILDVAEFNEYIVHNSKCTGMAITYDDKYVITCSNSCICIWKALNTEGKAVKLDKEFTASQEVLISRIDLEEKLNNIRDLQVRMNELQTEHAYQMRQNESVHNSTIKEIHEGYCSAIEELKEKNEILEQEHAQEISNINIEIGKIKMGHEMFVQKLEANYNEKLIVEYDKFILLEEKMGRMRCKYDKELEDLSTAKDESENLITNDFRVKLTEKDYMLEELNEKSKQSSREHEAIKQQIEDDADREIYELKTSFEKELREEQDINVRLRGETQSTKKRLALSQKQIDDLNHTVHTQEIEQHKLKTVIFGLEHDIIDLKKEILERDSTIQDKEKRIGELKHKNQELEKFRFILDFKINELKAQIEPRDRTIREQQEQINDMVNELENLQKIVLSLEIQLSELREKLRAADNEIKQEIVKNRAAKAALKRIRTDIHFTSGLIQDVPKLQKAVKKMYHKYNADKDFSIVQAEDSEAKNEFLRQRDFLERTVRVLKQQVSKKTSHGNDNLRMIDENSQLITETNILRKDLKVEQRVNRKMNALLGMKKISSIKESQKRLNSAIATGEEIREQYREHIEEDEKCISALTEEITRLTAKITSNPDSTT